MSFHPLKATILVRYVTKYNPYTSLKRDSDSTVLRESTVFSASFVLLQSSDYEVNLSLSLGRDLGCSSEERTYT